MSRAERLRKRDAMRMRDNTALQPVVNLLRVVVIVVASGDFPLPAFIIGVDIAGGAFSMVGIALLEAVAEVIISKRRAVEPNLLTGIPVLRGVDAVAGPRVRQKAVKRYLNAKR